MSAVMTTMWWILPITPPLWVLQWYDVTVIITKYPAAAVA